jgi:hypothetical protein
LRIIAIRAVGTLSGNRLITQPMSAFEPLKVGSVGAVDKQQS